MKNTLRKTENKVGKSVKIENAHYINLTDNVIMFLRLVNYETNC